MKDPYEVLGILKNATDAEIKAAYRKLAKKYHPDLNPNNQEEEQKFKDVNTAYKMIENEEAREKYEKGAFNEEYVHSVYRGGPFYHEYQDGGGRYTYHFNGNPNDIFEAFFGGSGGRFAGSAGADSMSFSGQDHLYKMEINLTDAVKGAEREIILSGGKRLKVKIPAGVDNKEKLRFKGQGGPGIGKGKPGDAYVEIFVKPDDKFRRSGANLEINIPINLDEAINGAKIKVPTIDGAVMLNIPPGVNNETRLRIKGKGMPVKKGNERGDQIVILEIRLPDKIDTDLKNFIKQWSREHPYNPRKDI